MIWHSLRYSASDPIRIDEPDGTTEICLASQFDTRRTNAISSLVAERRRRNSVDSSPVRTHAQARAELESARAWVPYMAGCEFPFAPVMRAAAQTNYLARYPAAYGPLSLITRTAAMLIRHEVVGTLHESSLPLRNGPSVFLSPSAMP